MSRKSFPQAGMFTATLTEKIQSYTIAPSMGRDCFMGKRK